MATLKLSEFSMTLNKDLEIPWPVTFSPSFPWCWIKSNNYFNHWLVPDQGHPVSATHLPYGKKKFYSDIWDPSLKFLKSIVKISWFQLSFCNIVFEIMVLWDNILNIRMHMLLFADWTCHKLNEQFTVTTQI